MVGCTLCEPWSAHQALRLGVINDLAPALVVDGKFVPNPLVITDRWTDEYGRVVLGEPKTGAELDAGQGAAEARARSTSAGWTRLVETLCAKLLMTFPNCMIKTIGSLRKHKLAHWQQNAESNREWLGLNMMTEAKAGFQAFNEGPKDRREVDFVKLRQLLAEGRALERRAHPGHLARSTRSEGRRPELNIRTQWERCRADNQDTGRTIPRRTGAARRAGRSQGQRPRRRDDGRDPRACSTSSANGAS